MKKTFIVVLGGLILAGGGCFSSSLPTQPVEHVEVQNTAPTTPAQPEKPQIPEGLTFPGQLSDEEIVDKQIRMETEKGTIVFELLADTAPLTVSNFVYLTQQGYYDGLTFHRVEKSLNIIQGGDPLGNGQGGPGYRFNDELDDDYNYDKGIVAMANAGPNTNGSQFFMMIDDFDGFTKNYTIFGRIIEGQEVTDLIEKDDKMLKVTVEDKGSTGEAVEDVVEEEIVEENEE